MQPGKQKAAVALFLAAVMAGLQVAATQTHSDNVLNILSIVVAVLTPLAVYFAPNVPKQ